MSNEYLGRVIARKELERARLQALVELIERLRNEPAHKENA